MDRRPKATRSPRAWALAAACLGASLLAGPGAQQGPPAGAGEPTVFRNLRPGAPFPALALFDRAGGQDEQVAFDPVCATPTLVALLRPDQEDSSRVLADLEQLALDKAAPAVRIVVVGLPGRAGASWSDRTKLLPRRIAFFHDGGKAAETLGLIVLPSLAVLSAEGRLYRAHVLHDADQARRLRADLELLASGRALEVDPAALELRRHEDLRANAAALERAGELEAALALRLAGLALRANPAEAQRDVGRTWSLLGDQEKAVEYLGASLGIEENVEARLWLARALARSGRWDAAEGNLTHVLALAPGNAMARREMAELCERRGDLDGTLEHLKAAIAASLASLESEAGGER